VRFLKTLDVSYLSYRIASCGSLSCKSSAVKLMQGFIHPAIVATHLLCQGFKDVVGQLAKGVTPPPTPLLLGEGSLAPPSLQGKPEL
jgi:hypothetical protein